MNLFSKGTNPFPKPPLLIIQVSHLDSSNLTKRPPTFGFMFPKKFLIWFLEILQKWVKESYIVSNSQENHVIICSNSATISIRIQYCCC